jgi:lysophospholipase L1-like esterase
MRRILFALIAALGTLLLLEAGAWMWERTHPLPLRTIPIPAPARLANEDLSRTFADRLEVERLRLGHGTPMVEDEERGWAMPPSSVVWKGDVPCRINSMGMRGPELAPKESGERRLFSLGDSSVFGHGVLEADVFTVVAAQALAEATGGKVSWAIGAVPGHDSGQALNTLEAYAGQVAPDWVLVATIWSDIYAKPGASPSNAPYPRVRGPLRRFALYRMARRALAPWLSSRKVRWIDSSEDIGTDPDGSGSRVPLKEYIQNLDRMALGIKRIGAQPIFMALPAPMDFDALPPPEIVGHYRAALALVAERHGGLFVDGPAILAESGAGIGWFLDEVHPSAEGHRLLGQGLAHVIAEGAR